jgi:hypothetical protein
MSRAQDHSGYRGRLAGLTRQGRELLSCPDYLTATLGFEESYVATVLVRFSLSGNRIGGNQF